MELGAWVTLAVLAVLVAVLFSEKAAPAPAVLSATLLLMLGARRYMTVNDQLGCHT